MRKLWGLIVFVAVVAFLSSAAVAQPAEDPPGGPNTDDFTYEVEHPHGIWLQAKYPTKSGPDEPFDNPWVIDEPLYPEAKGTNILTPIATSQGLNSGGTSIAPTVLNGTGAILSGPRSSGSARSSHQDARRGVKKVIRQLG